MPQKIWMDGKLLEPEHVRVGVFDHGLLYGDGVFEGIRSYGGRIFKSAEHLRRLYESARAIRMEIPYTAEQLNQAMLETMAANGLVDCYIRLVVTRGSGSLGIDPRRCPRPCAFIIADQVEVYPRELYEKGIAVITASTTRNHANALSPRIKSLNYLNNILARIEANDAGVPEAVMLNHLGNVAECTADNIFIVTDGRVRTPTTNCGILDGITRRVILELAAQMGIDAGEQILQKHDLYTAHECFVTGTGAEVCPVVKIDGRIIGNGRPGPITVRLMEAFHRHVRLA